MPLPNAANSQPIWRVGRISFAVHASPARARRAGPPRNLASHRRVVRARSARNSGPRPQGVATWIARGARVLSRVNRPDSALATSTLNVDRWLRLRRRRVRSSIGQLVGLAIQGVLDLAEAARAPIIVTRGSASAMDSRPGSLSDAELQGIARRGRVVSRFAKL